VHRVDVPPSVTVAREDDPRRALRRRAVTAAGSWEEGERERDSGGETARHSRLIGARSGAGEGEAAHGRGKLP